MTYVETFPTWSNTRAGAIWAFLISIFGGLSMAAVITVACRFFNNPSDKAVLQQFGLMAAVGVAAATFFLGFTDKRPPWEVYIPTQLLFTICLYTPLLILSTRYKIVDPHFILLLLVQAVGYCSRFGSNPAAI